MENKELKKDEMINNMDNIINELEDEALEAVAGGAGEDDWTSFECMVYFKPYIHDMDLKIKLLCDILSSLKYISHYEMYPLEEDPGIYKFVVTPVPDRRESAYRDFDYHVSNIADGRVFDKKTL